MLFPNFQLLISRAQSARTTARPGPLTPVAHGAGRSPMDTKGVRGSTASATIGGVTFPECLHPRAPVACGHPAGPRAADPAAPRGPSAASTAPAGALTATESPIRRSGGDFATQRLAEARDASPSERRVRPDLGLCRQPPARVRNAGGHW